MGFAFIGALIVVAFAFGKIFELRSKKKAKRARAIAADVAALGDDAIPTSIHPLIDPDRCIGSAACIAACPEDDVIGLVGDKAELINPLACIGHGACVAACPVDAISLVFGTAKKGVELPQLDETFQTSSPGIYVAGELGGMGLIRNAIEQGRQVAEAIAKSPRRGANGAFDAIIIGAGAAGISAALALQEKKLNIAILEREAFGGTIKHYPRAKIVMTGTLDIPRWGKVKASTMSKEGLLELWEKIREKFALPVLTGELVSAILPAPDGTWVVRSSAGDRAAANVVLALGRRGSPRKLGVPGEDSPAVTYRLIEPDPFKGKHVLIVGGGNAAGESAIALADAGFCKSVTLSYRRPDMPRLRGSVRERLTAHVRSGAVRAELPSEVKAIGKGRVQLSTGKEIENDSVIIQIGGTSPMELLASAGVKLVTKYGEA